MAYRNGTYIAFHANNTTEPTESDIKYYNLLKAWKVRADDEFHFINSHDKTNAVRDTSKRETLKRALKTRLRNSKNMILIIGKTTKEDTDWVPFEIRYAVDECEIPIIAAYTGGYNSILDPSKFSNLWPKALEVRIRNKTAHIIHIPFKKELLKDAVSQFSHNNYPKGGALGIYINEDTDKGATPVKGAAPGILGERHRFDVPHKQVPEWLMTLDGSVKIIGRTYQNGSKTREIQSNSPALPKQCSLQFEAQTNVSPPYEVHWQIVNTGNEALEADGLRGGFYEGTLKEGRQVREESTQYKGMHWIECFIVKYGICLARSGEFVVNIA